MGWDKVEHF
jgi:hypothetical protein